MKVNNFEELTIWQKANEIDVEIYKLADQAPLKMTLNQATNKLERRDFNTFQLYHL